MGRVRTTPVDVSEWIEPVLEGAPVSWCLPAYGGRVVVRGYDTYRSDLAPMAGSSRWMVDCTFVPLTAQVANGSGPHGTVFPGDCVIFFGGDSERPEAHLWYPQRVIHTETGRTGWQKVWAVRDTSEVPESLTERQSGALPRWMRTTKPLHGEDRRRALEMFWLNVDCPVCGARGRPIMYGMPPGPPGPHVAVGGCTVDADNPDYACHCGARWRVRRDGEVVVTGTTTEGGW